MAQVKEVLLKKCEIFKLQNISRAPVLVKPKSSVISAALDLHKESEPRIKLIKSDDQVFQDEVLQADRLFSDLVQENERSIFDLILTSVKSGKRFDK